MSRSVAGVIAPWITRFPVIWTVFAVASAVVLFGSTSVVGSTWHSALQPSPLLELPSSQVSPDSTVPLPHVAAV